VHNAVRHSGCTAVDAELCVEGREVLLRVRDNGRGLPNGSPSPTTGGNGIPSMRRRTQSLGGLMEWTSGEGGGCTVEVRLPIERHAFRKNGP
jgi:signal transduction histidine kinase